MHLLPKATAIQGREAVEFRIMVQALCLHPSGEPNAKIIEHLTRLYIKDLRYCANPLPISPHFRYVVNGHSRLPTTGTTATPTRHPLPLLV